MKNQFLLGLLALLLFTNCQNTEPTEANEETDIIGLWTGTADDVEIQGEFAKERKQMLGEFNNSFKIAFRKHQRFSINAFGIENSGDYIRKGNSITIKGNFEQGGGELNLVKNGDNLHWKFNSGDDEMIFKRISKDPHNIRDYREGFVTKDNKIINTTTSGDLVGTWQFQQITNLSGKTYQGMDLVNSIEAGTQFVFYSDGHLEKKFLKGKVIYEGGFDKKGKSLIIIKKGNNMVFEYQIEIPENGEMVLIPKGKEEKWIYSRVY